MVEYKNCVNVIFSSQSYDVIKRTDDDKDIGYTNVKHMTACEKNLERRSVEKEMKINLRKGMTRWHILMSPKRKKMGREHIRIGPTH